VNGRIGAWQKDGCNISVVEQETGAFQRRASRVCRNSSGGGIRDTSRNILLLHGTSGTRSRSRSATSGHGQGSNSGGVVGRRCVVERQKVKLPAPEPNPNIFVRNTESINLSSRIRIVIIPSSRTDYRSFRSTRSVPTMAESVE
jgi:hypothetical protein